MTLYNRLIRICNYICVIIVQTAAKAAVGVHSLRHVQISAGQDGPITELVATG